MAAVLCISVLVSITMGMQLARAQTCGTFAEAGENENSDGGLTDSNVCVAPEARAQPARGAGRGKPGG